MRGNVSMDMATFSLSGAKNDSLQSLTFMTKISRYTICNVFSTLVQEVFS